MIGLYCQWPIVKKIYLTRNVKFKIYHGYKSRQKVRISELPLTLTLLMNCSARKTQQRLKAQCYSVKCNKMFVQTCKHLTLVSKTVDLAPSSGETSVLRSDLWRGCCVALEPEGS